MEQPFIGHIQFHGRQVIYSHGMDLNFSGYFVFSTRRVEAMWQKYTGWFVVSLIARLMGPTWGSSGADRTQVGPMLAPWTLLSGIQPVFSSWCSSQFVLRQLIRGLHYIHWIINLFMEYPPLVKIICSCGLNIYPIYRGYLKTLKCNWICEKNLYSSMCHSMLSCDLVSVLV